MTITDSELREICDFDLDGILGFREQMRHRGVPALWPEHFTGARIARFERGAKIAGIYLSMRRGAGRQRKKNRHHERYYEGGMMTPCPTGTDRHAEQLETLRDAMRLVLRIEDSDDRCKYGV